MSLSDTPAEGMPDEDGAKAAAPDPAPVPMSGISVSSFSRADSPSFISSPTVPFVPPQASAAPTAPAPGEPADAATESGVGADASPATAGGERVVFRCEGDSLSARLEIAAVERASATALDLALIAADAEAAVDGLERWFGTALDLVPTDAAGPSVTGGGEAAPATLRIGLAPRAPGSLPAALLLPLADIGSLPPLPRAIELSLRVSLEPLATRCRIARLTLPPEQLARLGRGAVLLLPKSFGGGEWPVRLELEHAVLEATLDLRAPRLLVGEDASPASPGGEGQADGAADGRAAPAGTRVDIVLGNSPPLDPRKLFGGGGFSLDLPAPLPDCGFVCLVDGVPHLSGHVAPLGDGHAFFALDALDTDA